MINTFLSQTFETLMESELNDINRILSSWQSRVSSSLLYPFLTAFVCVIRSRTRTHVQVTRPQKRHLGLVVPNTNRISKRLSSGRYLALESISMQAISGAEPILATCLPVSTQIGCSA
jgi:hypothetical protein